MVLPAPGPSPQSSGSPWMASMVRCWCLVAKVYFRFIPKIRRNLQHTPGTYPRPYYIYLFMKEILSYFLIGIYTWHRFQGVCRKFSLKNGTVWIGQIPTNLQLEFRTGFILQQKPLEIPGKKTSGEDQQDVWSFQPLIAQCFKKYLRYLRNGWLFSLHFDFQSLYNDYTIILLKHSERMIQVQGRSPKF